MTVGRYGGGVKYGDGTVYGGGAYPFEVRVEHWDAAGNFLERVDPELAECSWEYRRMGGCGQGTFVLERSYPGIPPKRSRWAQSVMNSRPIGYWRLSETGGVSVKDEVGVMNGRINGPPNLGRPGSRLGGTAMKFDGTTAQSVSNTRSLAGITGEFSVECWVRRDAASSVGFSMAWSAGTPYLGTITSDVTPFFSLEVGGVQRAVTGTSNLTLGQWHHLVGTWDGDKLRLYLDGAPSGVSASFAGALGGWASTWYIGRHTATYGWNGWISDVALFDRALSVGEIAKRYSLRDEPEAPVAPVAFGPDHEIQVYVRDETGPGFTLFYRGLVVSQEPAVGTQDTLTISTDGYLAKLNRATVDATYTGTEVSAIVTDLLTNVLPAGSGVTCAPADVQVTTFTPDSISLLSTVTEAVDLLAKLAGSYEYGVDANKAFYFKAPSTTVGFRYVLGKDVVSCRELEDYTVLVNRVVVRGADATKRTRNNLASQALYGLRADVVHNTAATTNAVADQYGDAILADRSTPDRRSTVTVAASRVRVEADLPVRRAVLSTGHEATEHQYRISRVQYAVKANGLETTVELGLARPSLADALFRLASNIKAARPT